MTHVPFCPQEFKPDVVVGEATYICTMAIADLLKVPATPIVVSGTQPDTWVELGSPDPLAYVPQFGSGLSPRMNLWQRFKNLQQHWVHRLVRSTMVDPPQEALRRSFGLEGSLQHALQRCPLFLVNLDEALAPLMPRIPKLKYVGPLLTEPPLPLEAEWQSFMARRARVQLLLPLGQWLRA